MSVPQRTIHKSFTTAWLVALRERLRFLRGNMRELVFWPVAAILMALLGWALLFAKFREDRNEAAMAALAKAAVIANGHAAHLNRLLKYLSLP